MVEAGNNSYAQLAFNLYGADGLAGRMTNGDGYIAETYDPQGNAIQPVRFYSNGTTTTPQVAFSMAYDAFGESGIYTASGGGNIPVQYNPVGFGGQYSYYKEPYGHYLLGHRFYDPGTGRFVTRDPIGYKGGINLYGFTGNNPVNRQDPSGTYAVATQHDNRTLLQKAADAVHNWFINQAAGLDMREKEGRKHPGPVIDIAPGPGDLFEAFGVNAAEVDEALIDEALEESTSGEGISGRGTWSQHALKRAKERTDKIALQDAQQATQADVLIEEDTEGNAVKFVVRGSNSREHIVSMTEKRVITTLGSKSRSVTAKLGRIQEGLIRHSTKEEYDAFQQIYRP